jgi:threonine/homoserine/homoserine lactone efflux protein
MGVLITFIVVWALSPGPVAVMTIHKARTQGAGEGMAVAIGATITSAIMVAAALLVHLSDITTLLESDAVSLVEHLGALVIIGLGMRMGYTSIATDRTASQNMIQPEQKRGLVQGMMIMATYIPQALVFYNIIIPQTVSVETTVTAIMGLGLLKVLLILGWHVGIAQATVYATGRLQMGRFGQVMELAAGCLLAVIGINILI